jgi:hypothetical protein
VTIFLLPHLSYLSGARATKASRFANRDDSQHRFLHVASSVLGAEHRSKISQEILAELVGTTRSRVNFFMNKFSKLGFIHYNSGLRGLQVHRSLLNVVLHD